MHCPFHIFNERHGEMVFCRSGRTRLFSAALKRGIGISRPGGDNGPRHGWVAHPRIRRALFRTQRPRSPGPSGHLLPCGYQRVLTLPTDAQAKRQSLPAALLQGAVFPKRKINLFEEIPWNQSFSPQMSDTGPLESYFGPLYCSFTKTLYFYCFLWKKETILALTCTLLMPRVLSHTYLSCDSLHNFKLKFGSSSCCARLTQAILKTFKDALSLDGYHGY